MKTRKNTISLKNDFYTFVNKKWIRDSKIAKDEIVNDNFVKLNNIVEEQLKTIILKDTNKNVKNIYHSSMSWNDKKVEATIFELLNEMKRIKETNDIYKFLAFLILNSIENVFELNIEQSIYNPKQKIVTISAQSQTFSTIDYYTEKKYKKNIIHFKIFISKYFSVLNETCDAQHILDIEKYFVENTESKTFMRITENVYNEKNTMTNEESMKHCGLNWNLLLSYLNFKTMPHKIVLKQPKFIKRAMFYLSTHWNSPFFESYWTYKLFLKARTFHSKLHELGFLFFGKILYNVQKKPSLSDLMLENMKLCMNFHLNKKYIETTKTSPQICEYLLKMAKKILVKRLNDNQWLEPSTIKKAIIKVEKIKVYIGHKPRIDKENNIQFVPDNMFQNYINFVRWFSLDNIKKIKSNIFPDIHYLGDMDSYDVNANYSELSNSIFIPSGIIQPPFIDTNKSFIYNLAFLGIIICHELIHALDDEGCKYDENGVYKNWWTKKDKKQYKEIEKAVINLFEHFSKNTGEIEELKLGENIADIGSMAITEEILEHYLNENNVIDKTPYFKQFYCLYATLYKKKNYKSFYEIVNRDYHSYSKYRVNCVLANSTRFKDCFGITPKDKMYYYNKLTQSIW